MRPAAWVVMCVCTSSLAMAAEPAAPLRFAGNVSDLKLEPDVLGTGWSGPTGLTVDDLSDLSGFDAETKAIVEPLARQMSPKKIRSVADFTFTNDKAPPQIVVLRVFIFEDVAAAEAFWKERWQSPGTESLCQPVAGVGDEAADVKGQPKRGVRRGNVMLTCHQTRSGEEHLKLLAACLERLEEVAAK